MTKGGGGLANAKITEQCLKTATHQDILIMFCQKIYFLPKKMVIQKEGVMKYVDKTDAEKGGQGPLGQILNNVIDTLFCVTKMIVVYWDMPVAYWYILVVDLFYLLLE